MLDWDKPLSEQSESVQDALIKSGLSDDPSIGSGSMTGEQLYKRLANEAYTSGAAPERAGGVLDPQAAASQRLAGLGIPGNKFLDGTSRSAGEGTRNFVVFDESLVTPLKRNGEALGGAGSDTATDKAARATPRRG